MIKMPDLLLELLSEEIPARMQVKAADDLLRLVTDGLKAQALSYESAQSYATPRRLVLHVTGLPEKQPDMREERRGPRADAPEKAIAGFLASTGLSRDRVEERADPKGNFLYAVLERAGEPTARLLAERLLPAVIGNFPWSKSMRWGDGEMRWVRPLQSVLCLLGGDVVRFSVDGLESGNVTRGHRFHAPASFAVSGFADYREKLCAAYVVLDPAERQQRIRERAQALAAEAGLTLVEDESLRAENAGLTEWPVPLIGRFDESFLAVPPEVLTATMKKNQKYFTLRDRAGKMANRFICVANLEATDGGEAIVAGNERVLSARLSDARFFWDQDRRVKLEDYAKRLGGIVFHEKLGSVGDKAARMAALARFIMETVHFPPCVASAKEGAMESRLPGNDEERVALANKAERAASLAKADLVTGMVGEFPEVQGIMGGYYARAEGEDGEVADAIAQHYSPIGPTDSCPTAPVGIAVALADKIDTLVGFFGIDEKPTGSKDPYALRRAALGVLRLVTENGLRLPFYDLFRQAWRGFERQGVTLGEYEVALLDFFADRLKVQQREKGVPHDLIDAVFSLGGEDDLVRLLARVAALREFLATEDGANLLSGYRRAANIVRIEEKRDGRRFDSPVDAGLLAAPAEKALYEKLSAAKGEAEAALAVEDFGAAMAVLARLRAPVDTFFDHVTVNADDAALRENRLNLLNDIRVAVHTVADFSKIEG
jgi:glycyl-tRNA synthetase beta chain